MVDYGWKTSPAILKISGWGKPIIHLLSEVHGDLPLWPLSMLNNISFCQVAMNLDIQGENTVFSPHGDSGVMAVAEGMKALWDQRARVVLCGGVSEKVNPLSLARAHLNGILNTTGPQNNQLCRPFDVGKRDQGGGCKRALN
jgi:3-oxoacyl-[acyl-carrier-protein] synthase II